MSDNILIIHLVYDDIKKSNNITGTHSMRLSFFTCLVGLLIMKQKAYTRLPHVLVG